MTKKPVIVADENIPALAHYFGDSARLISAAGRAINSALLADADILLVRSVTRVNRALLSETPVKFVGSATIGVDHIDIPYLREAGIEFAFAPGCNARSVVEYVSAAICLLREELSGFTDKQFAVVGCGNVGSRLVALLAGLGLEVIVNDPLIETSAEYLPGVRFVSLEEALHADIISLHTPLTRDGAYPTYHLLDAARLALIKPGALLINTGRGAVIDNQALLARMLNKRDLHVVLDVWEHEPAISLELMTLASIATPHIAGYSQDGKLKGTQMLYQAVCDFAGFKGDKSAPVINDLADLNFTLTPGAGLEQTLAELMHQVYPIDQDDQRMREALSVHKGDRQQLAAQFDLLRKNYPVRRELANYHLRESAGISPAQLELLKHLGVNKAN